LSWSSVSVDCFPTPPVKKGDHTTVGVDIARCGTLTRLFKERMRRTTRPLQSPAGRHTHRYSVWTDSHLRRHRGLSVGDRLQLYAQSQAGHWTAGASRPGQILTPRKMRVPKDVLEGRCKSVMQIQNRVQLSRFNFPISNFWITPLLIGESTLSRSKRVDWAIQRALES
jgi:hypothetical protein